MITCKEAKDVVLSFASKYREAVQIGIPERYAELVMFGDDLEIGSHGQTVSLKANRRVYINYDLLESKAVFFEFIKKKVMDHSIFEIRCSERSIETAKETIEFFNKVSVKAEKTKLVECSCGEDSAIRCGMCK